MNRPTKVLRWCALLLISCITVSCGIKGDLYLPDAEQTSARE